MILGKMNKADARRKKKDLIRLLRDAGSLLVAFSGGVDSSFLLAAAHETLGKKVVAATAVSDIYPLRERDAAVEFTRSRGIPHILFPSDQISLASFRANRADRCYHCKRYLYEKLIGIAEQKGINRVADGANFDDLKDYRPGIQAGREMGIISPLIDLTLRKQEIRFLSREMGLPQWNKPAAACLASRIPYGSSITSEKLKMINEAEEFLLEKGLTQCRVRHHGSVARIEVARSELKKVMEDNLREAILRKFKEIGFFHIAVDMEGYISGSMNRGLNIDGLVKTPN